MYNIGQVKGVKGIFIATGFILLTLAFNLNAQEIALPEGIQAKPLSQAQSLSIQAVKPDPQTDPRTAHLPERMEAVKNAWKQHSDPDLKNSETQPSGHSAIQSPPKVRFRDFSGTPAQVKSAMLERAISGMAPGRKRDEKTARAFLRSGRDLLQIDDPDSELKLIRYQTDLLNRSHLRFSQHCEGLPVWPAELMVHLNPEGNVYLMNGAYIPTPRKMITQPVVNADEATELARAEVSAICDLDEAEFPASDPELIIYAPGDKAPRLAWKTELDISVSARWLVVTDALNTDTLTAFNQVTDANVSGTGVDLFGQTRSLNVWSEGGRYYMADTSRPMYNAAQSDPPSPDSTYGAIIVLDAGNQPPTSDVEYIPRVMYVTSASAVSGWTRDAVSAAHSLGQTYNYYRERHNRNSIDDKGCSVFGVVRLGSDYPNAFWNSETKMMYFGDAIPFAGALDVVAHELTHGVTSYTANLIYSGQSGALNESFSDIFGEMTESYATGNDPDWLMGTMLPRAVRSMSDPSSISIYPGLRYPSKMSEFIDTYEDNGGVHFNSCIVAHAFYLLADGLSGAIGTRDAERIFYRSLAYHLVSNSRFIDARLACIASAEELFGQGSVHALKTAEAFDAVEIFDDQATPDEPVYIPPVSGSDAALFVYYDDQRQGYYLGRQEQGDPEGGVKLSRYKVSATRPSVSGDGSFGVFVDVLRDMCFIDTDGGTEEDCMGWTDVASVAMSPDESLFGFVFLDENDEPGNQIAVFDMLSEPVSEGVRTFDLVAPTFSEGDFSISTIERADAMTFTSDNRYIIYDALNVIRLEDGSQLRAWSIYAIDLETEQTLVLVPPVSGLQIAFPSLSHTSDNFITFDALDNDTGYSTICALNLIKGELEAVAMVENWGTPCYIGDDTAIIYSMSDPSVSTQFSLLRNEVADDHISPVGSPELYLENGDYGTIYRRGAYGDSDSGDGDNSGGDDTDGDNSDGDNTGGGTNNSVENSDGGSSCFISTAGL